MFVCEMKTLRDLGLTQLCTCGSLCWMMSDVTHQVHCILYIACACILLL